MVRLLSGLIPKQEKQSMRGDKDEKYGDHYHMTPDGRNRMPHPETGDTHYQPSDIVPELPE